MKKFSLAMALSLVLVFGAAIAQADTFGFHAITNNNPAQVAIGEAQFFVDVTDPAGLNNILFTFRNTGPIASVIGQVYFDDQGATNSLLLNIAAYNVGNVGTVAFTPPATPAELPSANTAVPPFNTTDSFSAGADNPAPTNGVNSSEAFGIQFNLKGTFEFADVIAAINSGDLRMGIHGISLGTGPGLGGSESFVNNPVPLPPSAFLMGSGLLGLLGFGWRRKVKS